MFSFFRRKKKKMEPVQMEVEETRQEEFVPDFPLNECFLFYVRDKFFVGMCYEVSDGKLHFLLPEGVFITTDEVKVVREATQSEKNSVAKTKRELAQNQIVRYLRYVDL